MVFQGDLTNINLAGVFQNLLHNTQTGTLVVTPDRSSPVAFGTAGGNHYIYFREGRICMHSSGEGHVTPLAKILIDSGKLKPDALASAKKKVRKGRPLSRALHRMGISHEDTSGAVRAYVLEEIYDLFMLQRGNFQFEEGDAPDDIFDGDVKEANLRMEVNEVILEAARRVDEWNRVNRVIASPREVYVLRRERVENIEELSSQDQRTVAALLDGRRDVATIVEQAGLGRLGGYRALAEMLRNNLARQVSTGDLLELADEFTKGSAHDNAISTYRRVLEIEQNHSTARLRLADVLEAAGMSQAAATEHKLLATRLREKGDLKGALSVFERAIHLVPKDLDCRERCLAMVIDEMEDHATAARIGTELAGAYADIGLGEKSRETYTRLLTLPLIDPTPIRLALAETCVKTGDVIEAGRILKEIADEHLAEKRDDEAARVLRRAVEIVPGDTEARLRLEDIESGKLERLRERGKNLKRLAAAGVVFGLLATWYVYDVIARDKLADVNREAVRRIVESSHLVDLAGDRDLDYAPDPYNAAAKKPLEKIARDLRYLDGIPGLFKAVGDYRFTWAGREARRLEQAYGRAIIDLRLRLADEALKLGRIELSIQILEQVREGAFKPEPEQRELLQKLRDKVQQMK